LKVIVFGSTGGTGRAVIAALLAAGHEITAFARDMSALSDNPAVRTVQGDAMRAADVMLGARRTTAPDVCEVGTRNIIAAMNEAGAQRLVLVTAFGIGRASALPLAFKLFYRTVLREHMADKEKQEILVKASALDWTLVQPVGLSDAKPTGTWLADPAGGIRRQQISRADVATFLVSLLERGSYRRETVALSG
jgi:uncharacterized protein YbjT (DUF2867 family)